MVNPSTAAVIATFNQAAFAVESVLSIVDQVDEVIVVDDCSSDDTFVLLEQISHPAVHVSRNELNRGVSQTFNRAVSMTSADLIFIQGGDDRSLPGRVAAQAALLANPANVLAFSRPIVINSSGLRLADDFAADFFSAGKSPDVLARLLYEGNFICAPSVALRRGDYIAVGGFHPALDLLQDYDMWLRLASKGALAQTDAPLLEYRKHAANLSRDYVGLDSPRHRRLRAEQDYVRNSFFESATDALLDRIALGLGLGGNGFSALARDEKLATLLVAHPDKAAKRRGVFHLLDHQRTAFPPPEAPLGRRLDPADLPALMNAADHDNMGEVTQALRAGADIRPVAVVDYFVPRPSIRGRILMSPLGGVARLIARRLRR